jgi:tRNA nucleotidyltransferase (CCA-adding enzyme)
MTTLERKITGPGADHVLAVIRREGGRPMLVGGCVRDAILFPGKPAKDTDIEVFGLPDFGRLAYALAEAGFRVDEVGVSFGVLKVRADGEDIDVSLPRRESKSGTGHRGFTVIPDGALGWFDASARRDFTVNALMADPVTGEVTDFHGGLADLRAGMLRHTSAAFADDPLRVLRAVQFAARFGFLLAPDTTALCARLADSFTELAIERVWGEFAKIGTQGTHISHALAVLEATGWERHFPELAALHGIPQEPDWHPEGDVWTHSGLAGDQAARLADEAGLTGTDRLVVVFAALMHDFGKVTHTGFMPGPGGTLRITSHAHAPAGVKPARSFLRRIGAPHELIIRTAPLIREHMNCATRPTRPAVRRMARRLVPATMAELALVIQADSAGRGDPDCEHALAGAWLAMAGDLTVTERPARGLLTGHHLIAAGMTPGPAFGPVLAGAIAAQDDGEFTDEAGALRWLAARTA